MKASGVLLALSMWVCTCPAAGQAAEEKPQVVAIFMIENRGSPLTADELLALTDYLSTKLGERGRFQIIPRAEIRRRLTEQKTDSFKACFDQSCQIEIGRELAAGMTVSSSISKLGSTCIVTAALYDLQKAATANTATAKGRCTADDLLIAMEQIADKLQGIEPKKHEPPARVVSTVRTQPDQVPRMPPRKQRTKSTLVACLAAFLPGGGMFYLGKWGWGIFYVATIVGGIALFVASLASDDLNISLAAIGGSTYAISYMASWIHTYVAADDWKDPDFVREADKNARGYNRPALVVPVISFSF